ncbi:MAG: IS1595 family transposase [Gammaproteobacteria bacterium]|nr:IS1595 family transposase [Gammaproteobacteria bacterium]
MKTNSVMHRSPLSCRIWLGAVYLMLTSLKGVASTKLARDLGISQKSAWHLGHRLRAAFANGQDRLLLGPIEVDETYIGGKAKNQHDAQRDGKRGVGGKYPVVGILDWASGEVRAEAVDDTKKDELQGYLEENVRYDATVYSDEMGSYDDLPQPHEAVQHSTGEYVRGDVHTNSLESFWSMLKRGYVGIYHRFSQQHLDRYVKEYAKRRSMRELDTIDQMTEPITQFGAYVCPGPTSSHTEPRPSRGRVVFETRHHNTEA